MDFLLHRFDMPRGRPFIYDYCVMSTSQIKPKEIWSDRKRSSEWERKFLTTAVNLWQIWERFRVQWRPASIHRYSLSLEIFLLQSEHRRGDMSEMNGTNTSHECNWDPFIMIIIIGVRLLCVRMEILIKLFDEYWGRGVGAWGIL